MRICVIGTSNAIYKDGYCKGILSDPRVTYFEKKCVGASPSVIVPYFSINMDFSKFDWVIFDTAINDRNYYLSNSIRADQIRSFLEYGIWKAAQQGCKSALLVMPTNGVFDKDTIGRIMYHKFASEQELPIIDGFDYLNGMVKSKLMPSRNSCFIDIFHILKPVAQILGRSIVDKLCENDWRIPSKKSKYIYRMVNNFGIDRVRRQTSLSSSGFTFVPETGLKFDLKPNEEIIGISFNCAKTNAKLSFNGVCKSLHTKYFGSEREYQLSVAPVVTKNHVNSCTMVDVSISGELETLTESNRFEADGVSKSPTGIRVAEIESFLIQCPNP